VEDSRTSVFRLQQTTKIYTLKM